MRNRMRALLLFLGVIAAILSLAAPAQATRVTWNNETKCTTHNQCVTFGVQVASLNGKMYVQASATCLNGATPRQVVRCEYVRPKDGSTGGIRAQLFKNSARVDFQVAQWCGPVNSQFVLCPAAPFAWQSLGIPPGIGQSVWFANMEIKVGLGFGEFFNEFLSTPSEVWP